MSPKRLANINVPRTLIKEVDFPGRIKSACDLNLNKLRRSKSRFRTYFIREAERVKVI